MSFAPSPSLLKLYITLLLLTVVYADCQCGYTVDDTLYTDLIETDFLHLPNITTNTDWQAQNYTVTPELARGPYGKKALVENALANPLKSQFDWAGDGINGGDAGLQLIVRGGVPPDGLIPMAELATVRADLLYGSFRASMKVTETSGTCGAFFWYFNDTQEIDMEFLSAQLNTTSQPVNLVLQSSQSEAAGYDAANTRTYKVHQLSFIPSNGFHEYRFDWLSGSVKFFADGILLDTMEQAVPTSPGHITLSHWSTGNPNWSAGPPTTDAILTIQYLKGYFNSSDPTRQRDWAKRCMDVSAPNATCAIPDITEAPNGNVSAKTFFFSMQANETANRTVSGTRRTNQGRALEPLEAGKVASTVALLVGMACIMTWGW